MRKLLSLAAAVAAALVLSSILLPGGSAKLKGGGPSKAPAARAGAAALRAAFGQAEDPPPAPSADLAVTKTGPASGVAPDTDITYTIVVRNLGDVDASSVQLLDTLPAGTTFVSNTQAPGGPGFACTTPAVGSGGTVTCTAATLAVGASATFSLVVHLDADAESGSFVSNTASVSSQTHDPNEENDSSTASNGVAGASADLGVTKAASADTVVAGSDAGFTIRVTNSGGSAAADVSLTDTLPGTMTFVSLSQPGGWSCTTPAVDAGGTVTCTRPSFAAGGDATFTLVARVPAGTPAGTEFTNTATVASATFDPNGENNSSTVTVAAVNCAADPVVTNGNDDGPGSLRRAVRDACAGATISFDMTQVTSPVSLTSGMLFVNKSLTIRGPGANLLTVRRSTADGTPNFRVLFVNTGAVVSVSGLTLSNGRTPPEPGEPETGEGGGVSNHGTLTLTEVAVTGNAATGGPSGNGTISGGGIYNSGTLSLVRSLVSGNTVGGTYALGGGVANVGTMTATDSTLSGNTAAAAGTASGRRAYGGGLYNGRSASLTGCTVAFNSASSVNVGDDVRGGGLMNDPGGSQPVFNVRGSIVARNSVSAGGAGPDMSGTFNTDGFNLVENVSGWSFVANANAGPNVTGVDPRLGPLAANGGPTPTHLPAPDSPALDKGNRFGSATDQRGAPRPADLPSVANAPAGDGSDAGAVEANYSFVVSDGSPQSTTVNTNFPSPLRVTLDEFGRHLAGYTVAFSAPASGPSATFPSGDTASTDADGRASVAVKANTVAGGYNVTAAAGLLSVTFSLTNTPGAPASLTAVEGGGQSAVVNTAFPTQLKAKVTDAFGNPLSGVTVTFTAPASGAGAVFPSGNTAVTDAAGQASVPVKANTAAGSYDVTATAGALSATFALTNTPGAAASVTAVEGGGQSTAAGTAFPARLKAKVTDAFGNAVPGVAVTFTAPASGAGGTFAGGTSSASADTDASGVATAPAFTANTTAGTYDVTATASGVTTPASFSLTNLPPGTIQFGSASYRQEENGGAAVINVTRTGGSAGAASVSFSASSGTATGGASCAAGVDFVNTSGTLSWADGDAADKTFSVTICDDPLNEADETVALALSNLSGPASFGAQTTSTLTVGDNDPRGGVIEFAAALQAVAERGGQHSALAVKRTGDTTRAATVDYTTDDGSDPSVFVPCSATTGAALQRCDYTHTAGTIRFAAGEDFKLVSVPVNDDSYTEGPETTRLVLSNPTGGAVLGPQSQLTLQIDDDFTESAGNPIDDDRNFVRQHYHDFLSREPDAEGWDFWTNNITSCGADAACREAKRVDTSAAFFLSIEFQQTGFLVYLTREAAFGDLPGAPVPVRVLDFLRDTQAIGRGVVVGRGDWQARLEENRRAYLLAFAQSAEFRSRYPELTAASAFVNSLDANAGGVLTSSEKEELIRELSPNPSDPALRASVLGKVADNAEFRRRERNPAFVLMQYFGYLRRNPNDAPDNSFAGYQFWLSKLEQFGGDYRRAEMVKAFINSEEYRRRFGQQ